MTPWSADIGALLKDLNFDMSTWEYEFIAQYLAAVCKTRLPAVPPPPGKRTELNPLTLN